MVIKQAQSQYSRVSKPLRLAVVSLVLDGLQGHLHDGVAARLLVILLVGLVGDGHGLDDRLLQVVDLLVVVDAHVLELFAAPVQAQAISVKGQHFWIRNKSRRSCFSGFFRFDIRRYHFQEQNKTHVKTYLKKMNMVYMKNASNSYTES